MAGGVHMQTEHGWCGDKCVSCISHAHTQPPCLLTQNHSLPVGPANDASSPSLAHLQGWEAHTGLLRFAQGHAQGHAQGSGHVAMNKDSVIEERNPAKTLCAKTLLRPLQGVDVQDMHCLV